MHFKLNSEKRKWRTYKKLCIEKKRCYFAKLLQNNKKNLLLEYIHSTSFKKDKQYIAFKRALYLIFLKPHLHGRLFATRFEDFFCVKISPRVVTHTSQDSLAAIVFGKNRRRVSNTCDLRCRLYLAQLDARIVLARDHLHEVDFNISRVPGQSALV